LAAFSNTLLREVLQAHRDCWTKVRRLTEDIPNLKVYIVDLYPSKEEGIPQGFDEITDRQYDVLFHDKTKYDEKVAHIVSDYVNMGKKMKKLLNKAINTVADANKKAALEQERDQILLNTFRRSKSRNGGHNRNYNELLEGHFDVEVFRIERLEKRANKERSQHRRSLGKQLFHRS
jgi:NTE family protein